MGMRMGVYLNRDSKVTLMKCSWGVYVHGYFSLRDFKKAIQSESISETCFKKWIYDISFEQKNLD